MTILTFQSVGAVVITNSASATLVDFTGVTVASFDDGTASVGIVVFPSATTVNLGTALLLVYS